jgi:shikimate kinase
MATVILIGFSCAGKSTVRSQLRKYLRDRPGVLDNWNWVDTDKVIADRHEGLIYKIFLEHVKRNGDRSAAIAYLQERECQFLDGYEQSDIPTLIAAGPIMPMRQPHWQRFRERINPECIWLRLNAQTTLDRLTERQTAHGNKTINNMKLRQYWQFGSWNEFVLTYFHDSNRKWTRLPDFTQLANIEQLMNGWAPVYQASSIHTINMDGFRWQSEQGRAELERIIELLRS